jgi:hypothetical protein
LNLIVVCVFLNLNVPVVFVFLNLNLPVGLGRLALFLFCAVIVVKCA